jgi:hypothetical protein
MTNETKQRAEFFLEKKTLVHVKTSTAFYNGYIFEVHSDKIIIEDRLFGEIPLFFSEITLIEPYKVRGIGA